MSARLQQWASGSGEATQIKRLLADDTRLLPMSILVGAGAAVAFVLGMAELCSLVGAETWGVFLRDAGQQVGGAGLGGAAGAAAAGAATESWGMRRYRRRQLERELGHDLELPSDFYREIPGEFRRQNLRIQYDYLIPFSEATVGKALIWMFGPHKGGGPTAAASKA